MIGRRVYHRTHRATGTVLEYTYDEQAGHWRFLVELDSWFPGTLVPGEPIGPDRGVWRPTVNWQAAACSVEMEE